jgi:regulator of replication initiation timing
MRKWKPKAFPPPNEIVVALEMENSKLRERLNDIKEVHDMIMAEQCPDQYIHCTCVPVLRGEIKVLRKKLARMVKDLEKVQRYCRTGFWSEKDGFDNFMTKAIAYAKGK